MTYGRHDKIQSVIGSLLDGSVINGHADQVKQESPLQRILFVDGKLVEPEGRYLLGPTRRFRLHFPQRFVDEMFQSTQPFIRIAFLQEKKKKLKNVKK